MGKRIEKVKEEMQICLDRLLDYYDRSVKMNHPGWGAPDLSNSQYAILGLKAAGRARLFTPKHPAYEKTWREMIQLLLNNQNNDAKAEPISIRDIFNRPKDDGSAVQAEVIPGGWGYTMKTAANNAYQAPPTVSMTYTGIGSLAIAMGHLENAGLLSEKEKLAGQKGILKGLAWAQENYDAWSGASNYGYPSYALERAGVIGNFDQIGEHDWYHEGSLVLCSMQTTIGNWGFYAMGHEVSTSFALLFLKRASKSVTTYGDNKKKD